mgnify:CR=1 FL=1
MDVIFLEEPPRSTKSQTNLAKVWGDLLPSQVTDLVQPMLNSLTRCKLEH